MKLLSWLAELLYPTRCIICREVLQGGKPRICPQCREKIRYTEEGGKRRGDFFSMCVSSVYYEDAFRESFLRYKFMNQQAYAVAYGELLGATIYEYLNGRYDLVTWAPVGRMRLRKRGYDQAYLLAKEACRMLAVEPVRLLTKKAGVTAQSTLDSAERRRANIAGAYKAVNCDLIQNRRILVIDDIVTTGATLSECAKTLLLAGAEDVCCATLARTRK